jgi:hypothetical protein
MNPRDRIDLFIRAMLDWESSFDRLRRTDAYRSDASEQERLQAQARQQLAAIFDEHLTARARSKLAPARLDTVDTRRPPEFDMRIEEEFESKGSKAQVYAVQNGGFKDRLRFTLVQEGGTWRIDDAATWREAGQKWEKRIAL